MMDECMEKWSDDGFFSTAGKDEEETLSEAGDLKETKCWYD